MRGRIFLVAIVLAACSSLPVAQSPQVQGNLTAATCPAAAGCLTLAVGGLAGVAVQISGTYVGTVSFEATVDGSTYVALNLSPLNSAVPVSSTANGTGVWSGGVGGAAIVRARMSAYTSGTATVIIKAAPTSARGLGGTGGGGAPIDATYITQTADTTLTAEQALGALATGLMNNTTTTGVVSTLAPTDDNVVVGSGTAWALKALSSCSAADSAVTYNTTTNAWGCNTISASAGGSDTQVQFNDGGALGGDAGLTYNKTTDTLTVPLIVVSGAVKSGQMINTNTEDLALSTTLASILLYSSGNLTIGDAATTYTQLYGGAMAFHATGLNFDLGDNEPGEARLSGDLVLTNGKAFKTTTTTAQTALFQAYDVNDAAYVPLLTLTNANAPSLVIAPSGDGTVTLNGRLISTTATPAVSDTSANSCGSGTQTIVGTDNAGKVTVIGSVGTSCTVTFNVPFTNAPSCSVSNETTANLSRATSTTSTVILAGTFLENDVLAYSCIGR